MPSPPASIAQKYNTAGIASWLLLFAGLLPWFLSEWQASLDENTAWLLIGAQRLLHGDSLLQTFYDGDPPLNILIYAPAIIIAKLLHLPLWRGLFLYMAGLTAFAAVLVWRLAGLIPGIDHARRQVIVASFLAGSTILYHLIWGAREQFIFLFLFPLAMAQGVMTLQIPLRRNLKYAALIPGAAAGLIKPHFLVIPAVMLMHRAWKRKSILSPVRDADFIILTFAALVYAAVIFVFFRDYTLVVVGDLVRYYVAAKHVRQTLLIMAPFLVMTGMVLMASALLEFDRGAKKRIRLPLAMVLLCFIPCLIQMKGFPYHFVPAAGFLAVAIALFFQEIAVRLKLARAGALPGIAAALAFVYALTIFPPHYPGNDTYKDMPFPRYVREHAANGAFYVYMDNMGMVPQTALYTGLTDASRFPSLWFLPALLNNDDRAAIDRYAGYIAEDLARWKPSLLLIQRKGYMHGRGKNDFDFMTYFGGNKAFKAEMKHYKKTETKSFPTAEYFAGIPPAMSDKMIFDVYERRP
jgi:hypothetical protein